MPMPSANGIGIMDKEYGSSPSTKKSLDELKRQVTKLKAELESERSKLKQVHRDKTGELKRIQENYEKERHKTIESVTKRLQNEHSVELRRIRESLSREKDNELRQVLKFKDEELKAFKQQIHEEKDRAKRSEDDLKRHLTERTKGSSNEVENRLRDELSDQKEQRRKVEELYRLKCAADFEKAELIRRLKSEHEREVNELIRQSKREVAKEFHHLRSAEKALEEKNHELAFKDQLTRKLEAEKQEIRQRKTSLEFNISDSPLRSLIGSGTQESSLLESSPEADDVFQTSKGNKDKERELRKKNAELQSKLDRLEKKCTFLEKENASRQTGSQKVSSGVDEKVKKLKKRNSELVCIARQLEEKAKKLQEEKNATLKQANSKADPSTEVEHMKRMFARQRAKDLAEHARMHMEKDSELENLRKNLASLSDGKPEAQNDKIGELQSIIKKTAKERLWLEKKLSSVGSPCPSPISPTPPGMDDLEKRLETYTTQARTSEKEAVRLKKELESKEKECENLKHSAKEMTIKCSKLEHEREKFAAKCTMLHQKNVELGKRIKEINKLEEEIKCLKENLQQVEEEKKIAEQECLKLKEKLEALMLVKEDLKASEKQRKELETEHKSSLEKLKDRGEEIQQLHKIQEEATRAHRLAVTSLEHDLRSLEQKCADSDIRASNMKNELENMKSRQKRSKEHKTTQTSLSRPTSPIAMVTLQNKANDQVTNRNRQVEIRHESRDIQEQKSKTEQDMNRESNGSDKTDILNTAASRIKQLAMSDSEEDSYSATPSSGTPKGESKVDGSEDDDIAVLSRRINQAALSDDSSLSAVDNNYDSDASRDVSSMAEGDMADMEDNDITTSVLDEEKRDNHNNTKISHRKGEQISNEQLTQDDVLSSNKDHIETIDERYLQEGRTTDEEVEADNLSVYIARYSYDPYQHSPNECPDAELAFQAGDYLYVFGDFDDDGFYLGELMDGQRGLVPSNFVEKIADESDMSWMTNGVEHEQAEEISSSDEEENQTQTDVNEGESTNLVEKPAKVLKFSGKLHRNLRLNVEHIPDSNLGDIEEEDVKTVASREVLRDSHDGLTSDDTDLEPSTIPSPQRVSLSRQYTRSVLLNWKPADIPVDEVKGYAVFVNGKMRVMIKGGHNTSALIEDIDLTKAYRISVRTVTTRGDESLDQEAMLTIGKDSSVAPSDVKVTDISPTSAKLEWLPGNSTYSHEILVNGTPRRTVRPGTYQFSLTNLDPSEHYRIHVRAKNNSVMSNDKTNDIEKDSLAKAVEFTTQAGGLPDPPLDVHLVPTSSRSGPNTLEMSWIPVTITEQGTSNGARVTGYKVYLNDFTCAEVTSPTADCVTVASWMIERVAKKTKNETLQLVVRTQSSSGESVSSNSLSIPLSRFDFKTNRLIGTQPMGTPVKPKDHSNDESEKDSGNEQGYQDDNHNLQNFKEIDIQKQKNLINEKEKNNDSIVNDGSYSEGIPRIEKEKNNDSNVNDGSYSEGIPRNDDEKHVDKRQPPVPKARTKGKPVVWKMDVEEEATSDSGDSNKGEHGGSSDIDEDEQVEICSSEPLEKKKEITKPEQGRRHEDKQQQEQKQRQQQPIKQETVENNKEDLSQKNLAEHNERKMSGLSDIDMDELNDSLNSATSFKREEKKNRRKDENKEPFIYPLDLSDSEVGNSSDDEPLSVIDETEEIEDDEAIKEDEEKQAETEEDEETHMTYSVQGRSHSSHSASDSFRSDDDVMDLLGVEPEDSQERNVTAANVKQTSQGNKEIHNQNVLSPSNDGQKSLQKYLVTSAETPEVDEEGVYRNQTCSDIEADQREPSTPNETSTPRISRDHPASNHDPLDSSMNENKQWDQGGTMENKNYESDSEGNRTYTVNENEEFPDEYQEEEDIRIFIALYDYDPMTMSPNPGAEEDELTFNEGDLIKIYGDKDADGFYWGELDGLAGFVPHNMVSEVQVDDEDLLDQTTSSLAETHSNKYPPDDTPDNKDLHYETPDNRYQQNESPDNQYQLNESPDNQYQLNESPDDQYQHPEDHNTQYPKVVIHQPSDSGYVQEENSNQYPEDTNDVPLELSTDRYEVEEDKEEIGYEDPRNSMNYSLKPKKMVALFDYDPQLISPNPDSEVELRFRAGDFLYVYGDMDEDGFYTGEQSGVRGLVPSNFLEDAREQSLPSHERENSLPSQENSVVSFASQESPPGPSKTPNGTQTPKEDTHKKKKGLLSKGKQMLKKMTKTQSSKR